MGAVATVTKGEDMQNIWTNDNAQYAEFFIEFDTMGREAVLKITACHNYVVYANGTFLANGQYADYLTYKWRAAVNILVQRLNKK